MICVLAGSGTQVRMCLYARRISCLSYLTYNYLWSFHVRVSPTSSVGTALALRVRIPLASNLEDLSFISRIPTFHVHTQPANPATAEEERQAKASAVL